MLDVPVATMLLARCRASLTACDRLLAAARRGVAGLVAPDGKVSPALLEQHQFAAHGMAWQATYVAALRETLAWAERLNADGRLGLAEQAILRLGFAEFATQLASGIPMSQLETVRPADMGVPAEDVARFLAEPPIASLAELEADRALLAAELAGGRFGALGLDDALLEATRDEFLRFAAAEVAPYAQQWHDDDQLIPLALVDKLAAMGVFGLTVPEEHGGVGMGKIAMCVVSEALSGGYIGVGSLGTRSEIAAELIRIGGTPAQKDHWLPRIATGQIAADRGVHRAEHRVRPRQPAHPRGAAWRHLPSTAPRPGSPTARAPT